MMIELECMFWGKRLKPMTFEMVSHIKKHATVFKL